MVVHVDRDVDASTAPVLAARLRCAEAVATPAVPLVIDLTDVWFLGVPGLWVLLEAHERCAVKGLTLMIAAGDRRVLRPLRLAALDRRLRLYPTIHAAMCTNPD